jgi:DNA-binding NarL/FixJ family response regulator
MPENLEVIVLSRSELRRSGLTAALSSFPDVDVAGEATDIESAIKLLRETGVGNVVIDLEALAEEDLVALWDLGEEAEGGSVSMVAFGHAEEAVVRTAMQFAPVLEARAGVDRAIAALQHPEELASRQRRATERENPVHLTARERAVLVALSHGQSAAEAAEELGISRKTVAVHKRNLYAKLGARSQAEAVAVALKRGLLRRDTPNG